VTTQTIKTQVPLVPKHRDQCPLVGRADPELGGVPPFCWGYRNRSCEDWAKRSLASTQLPVSITALLGALAWMATSISLTVMLPFHQQVRSRTVRRSSPDTHRW